MVYLVGLLNVVQREFHALHRELDQLFPEPPRINSECLPLTDAVYYSHCIALAPDAEVVTGELGVFVFELWIWEHQS